MEYSMTGLGIARIYVCHHTYIPALNNAVQRKQQQGKATTEQGGHSAYAHTHRKPRLGSTFFTAYA